MVNRCNRPFGLEAMRLVQERLATPAQVDRIVRLGGGFPMGPFELMDLVGVDVGLEIAKSFYAQSFGEPRWQPSPLAERLVAAGRHGRKAGRGWHDYPGHRPEDPPAPGGGGGDGLVVVAGESALAAELLDAAEAAGWDAATPEEAAGEVPELIVDCGAGEDGPPLEGGPQLLLCDAAPLAALDAGGSSAGFFALPPFADTSLVELTRTRRRRGRRGWARPSGSSASIGRHTEWVGDAPGLVLGRIVLPDSSTRRASAVGEGSGRPPATSTRDDARAQPSAGARSRGGTPLWARRGARRTLLGPAGRVPRSPLPPGLRRCCGPRGRAIRCRPSGPGLASTDRWMPRPGHRPSGLRGSATRRQSVMPSRASGVGNVRAVAQVPLRVERGLTARAAAVIACGRCGRPGRPRRRCPGRSSGWSGPSTLT
jgi:hypothetical protein